MKRHLIDSSTGEIIDISRLRGPARRTTTYKSRQALLLDIKLAGALTLLVAALYVL